MRSRKPIFQQQNLFPNRYIIKPNLVKSKVFKSAKNTNCHTEASDNNNQDDLNEEFNINDAIEGKTPKRKSKGKSSKNTTFDNVTFNPFGPNAQRKKLKGEIDNKHTKKSNLGTSSILNDVNNLNYNEMDNENDYNNNEDSEEEYKRKMEFYKKMLKNDNYNNNINDNDNDEKEKEIENNNKNNNYNQENNNPNESYRLKKRDNPCLIDSQIEK
jgi:hypothetical protein